MKGEILRRNPWINVELLGVILVGAAKFLVSDWLKLKLLFMTAGITFWIGFIIFRVIQDPSLLREWGLRNSSLPRSIRIIIPVTILSILSCIIYGLLTSRALLTWNILPVLILYPVWGIIQQFLLAALLAGNMEILLKNRIPRILIVISTAILFALIHLPEVPLVLVALGLGCFTVSVFLKYRNIWTIGIFHGLFATVFYFFVLGIDPWQQLFLTVPQ
ncbi:MAG: CPBP family intramembrane metalloprotease [Candidatus Cloacimonetes bacterium]|nr:CPBP family intramembrane metalloprotease [Candidatus Cloacimonadota bacterium]